MNTMKPSTGRIIFLVSLLALVALPMFASAYSPPSLWPTGYWGAGGLVSCTGNFYDTSGNLRTSGVCTSLCDVLDTFINIVYFLISICFFILAPIFFAVGGIMIMVSGASPEMLSRGKSVLLSTVVGVAIVLCSYMLVYTFISVFNVQSSSGTFGNFNCNAQTN